MLEFNKSQAYNHIVILLPWIRSDTLNDNIIDQIIQIDEVSYENQEKKKSELLKIKQTYEEAINIYKKEKLNDAKHSAKSITEQMDLILKNEEEKQRIEVGKISEEIDTTYKNSEKMLIEKLLNELFVMEG